MSRSGQVEGVDFIEIVELGTEVTLEHQWSKERRKVTFSKVTEKMAFINWRMCGEYEINLSKGHLKEKKVQLWAIIPEDLKKIRNAVQMETYRVRELFKKNK